MKKKVMIIVTVALIGCVFFLFFLKNEKKAYESEGSGNQNINGVEGPPNKSTFGKTRYSIDEPGSLWVIVNKKRPLPTDFVPSDLIKPNVTVDPNDSLQEQQVKKEVAASIELMFNDAKKEGWDLIFASGYRSAKLQATYYNNYVANDGQEAADRYSARPGTSEHQTGLAFDIARADRKCYLEVCFSNTDEGRWLADNAYKYGFILRYPEGKENVTGYQYEPWHFRYVGKELAEQTNGSGQTLEEFFEL